MTQHPLKAVLLQSLFVNGDHLIQQGCYVDVRHCTASYAIIEAERNAMAVPRHFIAIIPPDSPRVHKRKKNK